MLQINGLGEFAVGRRLASSKSHCIIAQSLMEGEAVDKGEAS